MMRDERKSEGELPNQLNARQIGAAGLEQAEKAVQESKGHRQSLVANAPNIIMIVGRDGATQFINHVVQGIAPERAVGKSVYDYLPPEHRDVLRKSFERIFETGIGESYQVQGTGPDGVVWCHEIDVGPIKHDDTVVAVSLVCTDVAERIKAEGSLWESEERYRALVEGAKEVICVVDENGTLLFMNRTGAEQLGGKPEDYVGKTMWDLFPKGVADRQAANVQEVIRTQRGLSDVAITEIQGKSRWYDTTIEPLKNSSGKATAAMLMARDVTSVKQTEHELNVYRKKISRAEQLTSLGVLSATLAHELTQPLMIARLSIENALAEMEEKSGMGTVTKKLKDGLDEVSNMTCAVKRFRDFARRTSERRVSEVDLKAVAETTVELLDESAQRARVGLRLAGMEKLPPVRANEIDIEQIFFALVENAVQAADGKRQHQVVISGAVKDEQIELQFADDCRGIAPENVDKIFESFFTTKPPGEGTGLGLCVVRRAVSRAGGKISFESEAGIGSTFFVTLPIKAGEGPQSDANDK